MTESGIRELEIVSEGTAKAPADPDAVHDAKHSHTTLVAQQHLVAVIAEAACSLGCSTRWQGCASRQSRHQELQERPQHHLA